MTARTGMSELITELRGMGNVGTADYTISGSAYWTDDQLQTVLDRNRTEVIDEHLTYLEENQGGTVVVTRYYSQYGNYEQTTGGTAIFVVRDALHNVVASASYTPDYTRGEVIYSTNTSGSALYLTGRSYDLNGAAADVWDRKASQVVSATYSWATDNMRVDKKGMRQEAVDMARYYRGMSGGAAVSVTMERGDTSAY